MKKLKLMMITLMMCFTMNIFSQNELIYSEVIKVDSNISKSELYNRAKTWFVTTYNSSNDVLQLDDKENGQLIGRAIIKYKSKRTYMGSDLTIGYIKYTIKIFVKDGRYKYEISNFIHKSTYYTNPSSMGLITVDEFPLIKPRNLTKNVSNKIWLDIKNQINNNISNLILGLKLDMLKETETKINW